MGEGEIGFAVAVDVGECAAFGVEAVGDLFGLPHLACGDGLWAGVAIPPEAVRDPAGGDEIGMAIVIDVDDPFAAVVDELVMDADGAELMLLPLAAVGTGILVPVGSAEDVEEAVAVHVEKGDAFGVIGAETVGEEGDSRFAVGTVAGMLHAEFGGVGWILGLGYSGESEEQNGDLHEEFLRSQKSGVQLDKNAYPRG